MLRQEAKRRGQMQMICIDDPVPQDHLLRKIEKVIDLSFPNSVFQLPFCGSAKRNVVGLNP